MSTGEYEKGEQAVGSAANPDINEDGPKNTADDISAIPGSAGGTSAAATAERTAGGDRGSAGPGQSPRVGEHLRGGQEHGAGQVSDAGRGTPPGDGSRRRGGGGRRKRRAEEQMVPDATFTSYYGRPVVKAAPWETAIPLYLFMGGIAGGSSLLAAGADLTGRPTLRRAARISATGAISVSLAALVADLGRPERFLNMLRVFKPTSPMSVGTWILTAYGPGAVVAGAAEVAKLLPVRFGILSTLLDWAARPAGLAAAAFAPGVASYTAVLLTNTSTPAWHDAHRELPFVFVGSAAAASGGLGMLLSPLSESGPARLFAVAGAAVELAVEHRMEHSMGLSAEVLHTGTPGRLMTASKVLTAAGALGALLVGRRSRVGAGLSGVALLAASACTRFGVFEAGPASVHDPKYTIVPQRERLDRRRAAEAAARDADAAPPTT
ncbi:Formate-dependent nitrite reductase, membrane component NrfD [Friedmanniella luteola]|uniref:Formate-dependent nitrite reductase, membrane component NrfD n=1 Tax=Friedmanniella luteola TaxID=546871 RepID=A0A1H1L497_9ACTN|nr:NrfD/PsrC family molybdoenzyme membrane anchor subunit [Friedmanniella luteola]SDR69217.1 Formate-dependent nitrite reductase, membrane component NrfD [Friedmanniella luteola]